MRPAKYFEVTWYKVNELAKHRIILDTLDSFTDKVNELMKDDTISTFFVMTHNTMPKE